MHQRRLFAMLFARLVFAWLFARLVAMMLAFVLAASIFRWQLIKEVFKAKEGSKIHEHTHTPLAAWPGLASSHLTVKGLPRNWAPPGSAIPAAAACPQAPVCSLAA